MAAAATASNGDEHDDGAGREDGEGADDAVPRGNDSDEGEHDNDNYCTHKNDEARRRALLRDVPHFCAICLGEYKPSDSISWSSNPECTHVFHRECIVRWLDTLGKKRCSDNHGIFGRLDVLGGGEIPAKDLLNYRLECPCCRQEFVSRLVVESGEYDGDEEDDNEAEVAHRAVIGGGGDDNV